MPSNVLERAGLAGVVGYEWAKEGRELPRDLRGIDQALIEHWKVPGDLVRRSRNLGRLPLCPIEDSVEVGRSAREIIAQILEPGLWSFGVAHYFST